MRLVQNLLLQVSRKARDGMQVVLLLHCCVFAKGAGVGYSYTKRLGCGALMGCFFTKNS